MKDLAFEFLHSVIAGFGVAITTILTGFLTASGYFAANIGFVASFFGVILTVVMIAVNVQNYKLNRLKIKNYKRRKEDEFEENKNGP